MWIASKYGFFSIVLVDETENEVSTVQVRARARQDLLNLIKFGELSVTIVDTPSSDYCCRIVLPRAEIARVMALVVLDIDYSKFKEMIASSPDQVGKTGFYQDVWKTMFSYQMTQMNEDLNYK